MKSVAKEFPLIPVRDVIIFPHASVPISLKREKSVFALEEALLEQKRVFLTMQKKKEVDDPEQDDLYKIGTVAKITQIQRLPDGVINIMVEGEARAEIEKYIQTSHHFRVAVKELPEEPFTPEEIEKLIKPLAEQFRQSVSLGKPVPIESLPSIF